MLTPHWKMLGALVFGLALAAVDAPAWAHHVRIVRSEPAAGARLNEPPSAVLVLFDQPIAFPGSGLRVTNERGVRVDRAPTAPSAVDEASLALELPPLPSGGYTVTWRVTSRADGEFNEGSFGFTVLPDLRPLVFDRSRLGGLGVVLFTLGALGMLGATGRTPAGGQEGRARIVSHRIAVGNNQPAPSELPAALSARVAQTNREIDLAIPRRQRVRRVYVTGDEIIGEMEEG